MATVTRRQTFVDTTQPKRTRSLAFKLVPELNHSSGAFRKQTDLPRDPRPVLFPIHTNARPIRRLPRMPSALLNRLTTGSSNRSASHSASSQSPTVEKDPQPVGSRKRKRGPVNGNENFDSSGGLSSRGKGSLKRSKSAYAALSRTESGMDVDEFGNIMRPIGRRRAQETQEEVDEDTELEDVVDSSDEHYLYSAPPWQLHRLLKEDLLRLYSVAELGTTNNEEDLTKNELVNAILRARKSSNNSRSPRTRNDSNCSPPSSGQTDGNDAGAEESDAPVEENERKRARKLRRSVTTHANLGFGHPTTRLKASRSINFGADKRTSPTDGPSVRRARFASELKGLNRGADTRQRSSANTSYRSSPSSPGPSTDNGFTSSRTFSSLRQTRSRQASKMTVAGPKGKGRHVEFSDGTEEVTEGQSKGESTADEDGWEDEAMTPTKRKAAQAEVPDVTPTVKRTKSNLRETAALTRSESKKNIFSPKKLRPRASRTIMNSVTNLNTVAMRNHTLRRSSSRRNLSRKVKRGGSLREPDSSDDVNDFEPEAVPAELVGDVEEVSESGSEAEEQDSDVQLETAPEDEDEDVDELMDDSESAADVPIQVARAVKAIDPRAEESDLTEPSEEERESDLTEEEEDDNYGSQAEESPAPEHTPLPARTRARRSKTSVDPAPAARSTSKRRSAKPKVSSRESGRGRKNVKAVTPCDEEDEDEASEEDVPAEEDTDEVDAEQDSESIEVDQEDPAGSDEESHPEVEPRVLRNGKVVGAADEDEEVREEEDQIDESDSGTEAIEEDEDEGAVEAEDCEDVADGDDVEVEDDDDDMEDDFDLSEATAKTLSRLRRDDLVKLCETRDLEAEGTKIQLVNSLLDWRDEYRNAPSSSTQPSSNASTARAPLTYRQNSGPVLLRNDRIHVNQPRTPDPDPDAQSVHLIGSKGRDKEREPDELELDLESLGLEEREIAAEKLTKLEKIGSGGFKDVFIGKYKGRKVAIAEFRGHLGPMDIKELKLLSDFNHPNVVRFLGVSIPDNVRETPVMMISELCTNGDLFDYVRNVPPPPLKKALNLMLDIARGLDYLHNIHKPSVIHRDCKSSNILITSKVTAKIADFGLAKVKQSTRSMVKSLVGTVNWQAPELWHAHPKYDHKVDVFSCAMVFWEILQWHNPSKKYPWEGMNEHAIYEEVGAKKHRPSISGFRKLWCPEIVDLVERMWKQDPKERPPISEVVDELEAIIADL